LCLTRFGRLPPSPPSVNEIEVLPVRVTVDLDRFVEFGGGGENLRPVGPETRPEIVNASPRMTDNVKMGISNGREIAICLVVGFAQGGMKRAEDEIQSAAVLKFLLLERATAIVAGNAAVECD
jgi:hypothetical protein